MSRIVTCPVLCWPGWQSTWDPPSLSAQETAGPCALPPPLSVVPLLGDEVSLCSQHPRARKGVIRKPLCPQDPLPISTMFLLEQPGPRADPGRDILSSELQQPASYGPGYPTDASSQTSCIPNLLKAQGFHPEQEPGLVMAASFPISNWCGVLQIQPPASSPGPLPSTSRDRDVGAVWTTAVAFSLDSLPTVSPPWLQTTFNRTQ